MPNVLRQVGIRSEKLKQHLAPDQNPRSGRQQAEILRSIEEIWYRHNFGEKTKTKKKKYAARFYQLKTTGKEKIGLLIKQLKLELGGSGPKGRKMRAAAR